MKNDNNETRAKRVELLSEVRSPILIHETESDSVSPGKEGGVVLKMRDVGRERTKEEWAVLIKESENNYNVMAREWNKLPGVRLVYPRDKFRIKYHDPKWCPEPTRGHKKGDLVQDLLPLRVCYNCGYPYKGTYE